MWLNTPPLERLPLSHTAVSDVLVCVTLPLLVHLIVDPAAIVTVWELKEKSSIDTSTVAPGGTQVALAALVGLGGTVVAVAVRVAVEVDVGGTAVFVGDGGITVPVLVGVGVPPPVTVSHAALMGPQVSNPP